jgi:outer membrane protein
MKPTLSWLCLAALLAAGAAQAQTTGQWMLRGGFTRITPDVDSEDLTAPAFPGTKVDVGSSTRLSGGISYMLTPNVSLDFPLALRFTQDITGDGAIAGVGKLGDIRAVPVTLFAQYRFGEPAARFRPFVGAGPTYAKLFKAHGSATLSGLTGGTPAQPTLLSADSRWGMSFQVGASVAIDDHWFVEGMVAKTFLNTTATLSTGQSIGLKLNPMAYQIGLGYKF